MAELNMIFAFVTVLLAGLVARAYVPHIQLRIPEAVDYLALALGLALVAYVCRTFYWDVAWFLMGNDPSQPAVNIPVNAFVIVSQLLALKARLVTIPADKRGDYNLFTCAFYPRSVSLSLNNRRSDQ